MKRGGGARRSSSFKEAEQRKILERLSQYAVVFSAADLNGLLVFFKRGRGKEVLFVSRSLSVLSPRLLLPGDDDEGSEREVDILISKKLKMTSKTVNPFCPRDA